MQYTTIEMKNLPAEVKTWVLASRQKNGALSFFYTTDSLEEAGSILEWYESEMVMVHKSAVKLSGLKQAINRLHQQ